MYLFCGFRQAAQNNKRAKRTKRDSVLDDGAKAPLASDRLVAFAMLIESIALKAMWIAF